MDFATRTNLRQAAVQAHLRDKRVKEGSFVKPFSISHFTRDLKHQLAIKARIQREAVQGVPPASRQVRRRAEWVAAKSRGALPALRAERRRQALGGAA